MLKEQTIVFTTTDANGNVVLYLPVTTVENVEGAIKNVSVEGQTMTITYADDTQKTFTIYEHPDSGVTAGTYKSVTVDAQGHVVTGSNPTTLEEYGITDAYNKTEVDGLLANSSSEDCLKTTGGVLNGTTDLGDGIIGTVFKTAEDSNTIMFQTPSFFVTTNTDEEMLADADAMMVMDKELGYAAIGANNFVMFQSEYMIDATAVYASKLYGGLAVALFAGGSSTEPTTKLMGAFDGTWTIDDDHIARSVNGIKADSLGNIEIPAATTAKGGIMSAEDKAILNRLAALVNADEVSY